ncbi:MAG: hypothetical protein IPN29_01805 [Saprospiraceae bacterium]|nr:hypothetical protein [Saprospiraceae bacterium]
MFAVPWHNKIVLGATDTPVKRISTEPIPFEEEINFVLTHIGRYLTKDPQRSDVKYVCRVKAIGKRKSKKQAALARDHLVTIADSGMITITGGKWTTYRKMAEDVVNIAIEKAGLEKKKLYHCRHETGRS